MPHLFEAHEPRAVYPVFADCENRLNYVLRETYIPDAGAVLRHAAGRLLRRDRRIRPIFLARALLDSLRGIRISFRGAFLDRDGRLVSEIAPFATVQYRQGFDVSVNHLLARHGAPLQDGQFLLIADRGIKLDGSYAIGTVGAVYRNARSFACYRNGAFARPLNEFAHHVPKGFRSVAPHMVANGTTEASAYFFNFSSDPGYTKIANPNLRLYRRAGEYLEARFGPIPAFGAAEKSLSRLFGDDVSGFLAETGGMGTLLAQENGVTLGSIHLIRDQKAGTLAIEHTRPTHMYVV